MDTKKKLKSWFETEVQYPRTISSLIRAVFLQFLTLFLFISLQTFDPLHPISWISASIGLLITPTSWFYDLIAIITVSTIGLLYSQQLSCKSWIPKNPISNLTRFFHPQILCSFVAHFVAGGVLMRSYLGLLGGKFNSLTILERSQRFLNVPHMFLVLSGCFQALAIWREFHFNNSNVLAFPLLAQTGNAQLGRQVPKMAKNSVWNVVLNLRWFYAFYAILGHRFVNILSEITRLETSASSFIIVPSLWNHLEMFLQCVLLNGLLTFSLRLLRAILCINFTKRHQFEVEGEKSLTLAMSEDNPPLLSHLAFYDFNLMASESRLRRSHFYILSQPGGHPHNWNNLNKACLGKIQKFITKLNESVPVLNPATAATKDQQPSQNTQTTTLYSTGSNLRPLATTSKATSEANNNQKAGGGISKAKVEEVLIKSVLNAYPVKILKAIKEKFSNNALFNSAPDAETRSVFDECQVIIWAVEGLSFLISSSINEDRYGVVQKDLPTIIATLFTLQKTVDKHKGVTISSKKNRSETRDLQLKQELRTAIKSSIYRIISTFGDHLDSLPISSEWHKKINNYKLFHEG